LAGAQQQQQHWYNPWHEHAMARPPLGLAQVVVAQVEFERHILKPELIFKGTGLQPVAFNL
jgi:hypothetical protein